MTELPEQRARKSQWQIAAKRLLQGDGSEAVTVAVELALFYEARLDVKHKRVSGVMPDAKLTRSPRPRS
jgi:hypothetical protein